MANAGIKGEIIRTVPKEGLLFAGNVQILEPEEPTPDSISTAENITDRGIEPTLEQLSEPVQQANVPSSTELTPKNSKFRPLRFIKKLQLLNPLLILMFAISFIYLINNSYKSNSFFDEYRKIADINRCVVIVDKNELTSTEAGYIQFLNSRNVVCRTNQFLYITDERAGSPQKVVQRCEKGVNENAPECQTLFPIPLPNGPTPEVRNRS